MPRPKGPGAIKFINPVKPGARSEDERQWQDDVDVRRALWRGGALPELQAKLTDLGTVKSALVQKTSNLHIRWTDLRKVNAKASDLSLERAKEERDARTALRGLEIQITLADAELASTQKQFDSIQKQIDKMPRSRRRKAAFPWQERAVQLMMFHKFRHTKGDAVLGTHGATVTTDELQKQLYADGFKIGARELRRFMRQCGVAGQRGKRTDLTSDNTHG